MSTTCAALAANAGREEWPAVLERASREVFELMLGCQLTSAAPTEGNMEITSMVGLAGKLCGVLSVRCNHKGGVLMASKMLGVEPANIGTHMSDALGEIANMVAGNFKNKIKGLSGGCMLSVPTVIIGQDYQMQPATNSDVLELNLLCEKLPLKISLVVHH